MNMIHLLANVTAMFWVGYFLESEVGSVKLAGFILLTTFLTNWVFCSIYKEADCVLGGSVCVFSTIGLMIALQIFKIDFQRFRIGIWYGNWILAYGIVSQLPIMSFMNVSTAVIHAIALIIGTIIGAAAIFAGIL